MTTTRPAHSTGPARPARTGAPPDGEAAGTAGLLRRGVLGLALLGAVGIALEQVVARHWQQPVQLLAWAFLAAALAATALVAVRPRRASVLAGRGLALAVALGGALGAFVHVRQNYLVGASSDGWDQLSEVGRWWSAATGAVGYTPPLVPLVLGQVALVVALATVRHPALRGR